VQGSKQIGHLDSSSRNFLRDARKEDNVKIMMRRINDNDDAGNVLLRLADDVVVVC
jgi:hypothetical protein